MDGNVGETERARQTHSHPRLWLLGRWVWIAAGGVLVAVLGWLAGGSLIPVLRSIEWAAHAQSGIGDRLYVDHRRADVFVTHELLY